MTSAKPIEKCAMVQVSFDRKATNGILQENSKHVLRSESKFCNISDECRTSPDDFDREDMLVWIFNLMAMMVMMMASCIGQWTCTLGEIFRKGTESCSK